MGGTVDVRWLLWDMYNPKGLLMKIQKIEREVFISLNQTIMLSKSL